MKRNKIRIWQRKTEVCRTYGGEGIGVARYSKKEILLWKQGWIQIGTFISKAPICGDCYFQWT